MEVTKTSSSRRLVILMGLLLALLGGYIYYTQFNSQNAPSASPRTQSWPHPPSGTNSISHLQVKQDGKGKWVADFDYFFAGGPIVSVFEIQLLPTSVVNPNSGIPREGLAMGVAKRGAHHLSIEVPYPFAEGTSQKVSVNMRDGTGQRPLLATQTIDQVINWPNPIIWQFNQQMAEHTPEQNLQRAVEMIDSGGEQQLGEARFILERLIDQNRQFEPAYIELARIAMKSNWSPEGLHQAETLLDTAMNIRPDSVDAKILLGYVYAHQQRFDRAQKLFGEAAQSNPANTWLWTNWGELLLMQHKDELAIGKFREVLARPMSHGSHDRARESAYISLLTILDRRRDLDGMEALYKQRIADFGPRDCYSSEYARFMLQVRGDAQGAIDIARRGLEENCGGAPVRQVLGLAEYVKWATTSGPEQAESLSQARIYLPAGPMPLYLLARDERNGAAIKKLIATGEHIDELDSDRQTALSYALSNGDLGATRRLLALHANPEMPVGSEEVPVALLPVMQGNIAAVRLLREQGVNYSKLRYRGITAFDFARQSGNEKLLQALGHSETTL